jgi:hypothetical protein
MKVTVEYIDEGKAYTVDFFVLAKKLGITEEQIKKAVLETLATT